MKRRLIATRGTRCVCINPERGDYGVCRRCGGEHQRAHSAYCDCPRCEERREVEALSDFADAEMGIEPGLEDVGCK